MIKEFTRLGGGIEKLSEATDIGLGFRNCEIHRFTAFYHPAKELMYRGKQVVYQICEMSDTDKPFILIPGYKRSEAYLKGEDLAVKVEPVEEREKKGLKEVIKKVINADWEVSFW